MSKKTTTLYLDKLNVDRCKELGINISEVVNKILKVVIENPAMHEEEILLDILLVEREKAIQEIGDLEKSIEKIRGRLEYLDTRIEKQKGLVTEARRGDEIAFLMRQLNQKIKDFDFDFEQILDNTTQIRARLATLGFQAEDKGWLTRMIERTRRLSA